MENQCKTVSFCSYRGGTGQSTTLANLAHSLSSRGFNVGCMDLNLSAPDLQFIFPEIDLAYANHKTLHDYVKNPSDVVAIEDYVIDVVSPMDSDSVSSSSQGKLAMIGGSVEPPGHGDVKEIYKTVLNLKDDFIMGYDLEYLLLDVESGLNNHLIPALDISDQMLIFQEWNAAHTNGTIKFIEWLQTTPLKEMKHSHVVTGVAEDSNEENVRTTIRTEYPDDSSPDIFIISDYECPDESIISNHKPSSKTAEQYQNLSKKIE